MSFLLHRMRPKIAECLKQPDPGPTRTYRHSLSLMEREPRAVGNRIHLFNGIGAAAGPGTPTCSGTCIAPDARVQGRGCEPSTCASSGSKGLGPSSPPAPGAPP